MSQEREVRAEIDRDAAAAAVPAADLMDGASIKGYEVRHAVGPGGVTDTWDPDRPVEVVVVGRRYDGPTETFEVGRRLTVPMSELLPSAGCLQVAAEYDLAQERARQMAPKIAEATTRRLANEAQQREQFNNSLTPERQKILDQQRAAWLAKQPKPAHQVSTAGGDVHLLPTLRSNEHELLDGQIAARVQAAREAVRDLPPEARAAVEAVFAGEIARLTRRRDEIAKEAEQRSLARLIPTALAMPKTIVSAPDRRPSVRERLQELQDLMQEGLISPEIYTERQAQIVSDL